MTFISVRPATFQFIRVMIYFPKFVDSSRMFRLVIYSVKFKYRINTSESYEFASIYIVKIQPLENFNYSKNNLVKLK